MRWTISFKVPNSNITHYVSTYDGKYKLSCSQTPGQFFHADLLVIVNLVRKYYNPISFDIHGEE